MSSKTTFKCLNCNEKHLLDPRNRLRQKYCSKPECQQASKAASQRLWMTKVENRNYFQGVENCERVRQWRQAHPGYWRKKSARTQDALQEISKLQATEIEIVKVSAERDALQDTLQDVCRSQHAMIVGLISIMTGHQSQEDITASVRVFINRGQDILAMKPKETAFPEHDNHCAITL